MLGDSKPRLTVSFIILLSNQNSIIQQKHNKYSFYDFYNKNIRITENIAVEKLYTANRIYVK